MQSSLALTALLMGLAGGPHCVAMCGAACAGLGQAAGVHKTRALGAFQIGRLFGYSLLGGLAARLAAVGVAPGSAASSGRSSLAESSHSSMQPLEGAALPPPRRLPAPLVQRALTPQGLQPLIPHHSILPLQPSRPQPD